MSKFKNFKYRFIQPILARFFPRYCRNRFLSSVSAADLRRAMQVQMFLDAANSFELQFRGVRLEDGVFVSSKSRL